MTHVSNERQARRDPIGAAPGERMIFDTDALECARCAGLLVSTRCLDLDSSWGERWCWALRCVQCGDLTDPVILENRHRSRGGPQETPVSEPEFQEYAG